MDRLFDGLLVLDKPQGITSRDAVDRAMPWFPRGTRIGHTGTLDPLATGVLVLCLGPTTRLVEYVQQMSKTYHSLFRLGATSDTDDADGRLTPVDVPRPPTREAVTQALAGFVGTIEQVPPAYSAARVTGKRAYTLARHGVEVQLQPRAITIHGIDVRNYAYPDLEIEVRCGKGTYIRSLARDLGQRLGCGGHVHTLRRLRVGPFRAEDAVQLDTDRARVLDHLLAPGLALAELPRLVLAPGERQRLCQGQRLALPAELIGQRGEVGIFASSGEAIAVAFIDESEKTLRPAKVFVRGD